MYLNIVGQCAMRYHCKFVIQIHLHTGCAIFYLNKLFEYFYLLFALRFVFAWSTN